MNRLIAEKNNPQADVYWANEPIRAEVLRQQHIAAPYLSPNADGIPARFRDPQGTSEAGFKMWEESDIAQFEVRSRERLARWRINLGAGSRVFGDHGQFDGDLGDAAQGLQQAFGGVWRGGFLGKGHPAIPSERKAR
jgi:hypothetical protein